MPIKGNEFDKAPFLQITGVAKQRSKQAMPCQCVALFAVALYTLLMLAGFAYCSRCDISQPGRNCLTPWMAFQDSLLNQCSNLLRLDFMLNQPSRLTPTVVKVIYNHSIAGLDDSNSTCVDNNCSVVLGWTAKSLYRYFHVSLINQLQFQLPFLILYSLEDSELRQEPDVDEYLWVGDDQTLLPKLYHCKLGSQYDAGAASVTSVVSVTEKCLFFTSQIASQKLNFWTI